MKAQQVFTTTFTPLEMSCARECFDRSSWRFTVPIRLEGMRGREKKKTATLINLEAFVPSLLSIDDVCLQFCLFRPPSKQFSKMRLRCT